MKKTLSLLLTVLMISGVFCTMSCGASAEDEFLECNYIITEGYVYNIAENTEKAEFLQNAEIFSSVNSDSIVGTGDKAEYKDGREATVIVRGDSTGDGKVSSSDYLKTKRTCLGTYTPTPCEERAMKQGNKVSPSDYLMIKRHVLGTYDLFSALHYNVPGNYNGIKVAYIPLDNRPVNFDRVVYLAQAAGFDLLIPDEDLFRTALDNMPANSNGTTYGDRRALLDWLKSVEDECDYYVISLDQMLSGGLVSSRWLDNTDLSFEKEIADYLIKLAKTKHVTYFDTVMRLASTVNYKGYDLSKYSELRQYGAEPRPILEGSDLNVDSIIANYDKDVNGNTIHSNLTPSEKNKYFASRARKLRLIDYILRNADSDIEYLYIGVDDSSPTNTIQSNEIRYMQTLMSGNSFLFAGADELGMMGIASVATQLFGQAQANVTYFGEGRKQPADSFDIGTLEDNVSNHHLGVGATLSSSYPHALQVLILTKTDNSEAKSDALIMKAQENLRDNIPTVIIDCSTRTGALQWRMSENNLPLSTLMGYSNWNTVGNSLGLAISQGVARYSYIRNSPFVSRKSDEGFLKSLTFAYIKDISYKSAGIDMNRIMTDTSNSGGTKLLSLVNSSELLTKGFERKPHGNVSV